MTPFLALSLLTIISAALSFVLKDKWQQLILGLFAVRIGLLWLNRTVLFYESIYLIGLYGLFALIFAIIVYTVATRYLNPIDQTALLILGIFVLVKNSIILLQWNGAHLIIWMSFWAFVIFYLAWIIVRKFRFTRVFPVMTYLAAECLITSGGLLERWVS